MNNSSAVVALMPPVLTEKAIEAALKIRFQAALKDGQPITVTIQEGFYFSIY